MRRLVSKLTKENLWIYVAAKLMKGPLTGYEVVKAIREEYKIPVSTVTVYVVLYKMARDGLIEAYQDGDRKYYRLTELGLEMYKAGLGYIEGVLRSLGCDVKCSNVR